MTTALEPDTQVGHGRGDDDDDLDHIYCDCDPNRSLCGIDITDLTDVEDEQLELPCVVCVELDKQKCARCGR